MSCSTRARPFSNKKRTACNRAQTVCSCESLSGTRDCGFDGYGCFRSAAFLRVIAVKLFLLELRRGLPATDTEQTKTPTDVFR